MCRDEVVEILWKSADDEVRRRAAKIAKCSQELVFGVRQTGVDHKGRPSFTVAVVQTNRCGQTGLCPIDIAARQRRLSSQVRYAIEPFLGQCPGYGAWWFTLTQPRVAVESTWLALEELKDAAVRRLFRRKDWPVDDLILMYEPHIGQTHIDFSEPLTAHVHVHVIGLVDPDKLAAANKWDYERLSRAWSSACGADVFAHLQKIPPKSAADLAYAIADAVGYGCKGIYRQGRDSAGILFEPGKGMVGEEPNLYYSNSLIDDRVIAAYLAKPKGVKLYSPMGVFKTLLAENVQEKKRRRQRDAMAAEKCALNWDAAKKAFVMPTC